MKTRFSYAMRVSSADLIWWCLAKEGESDFLCTVKGWRLGGGTGVDVVPKYW